ncbi:MAG TPA: FtsX-like permease family protein, partial [Gemmatimonadota bacterium]|nr:FtsX-like permease family protein [Gemmatimonadota bacterium]
IRRIIHGVDGSVPITRTETMDAIVSRSMQRTSFTLVLLGIAAVVALFLAAIGLFGVVSYVVSQRTREIGIRMALGADGRDVRGLVLRQAALRGATGTILGLLGAIGLTRLMASLLYGISATDPVSYVAAPAVLLGIVALATWLPARRASGVDPAEALRAE